MILITAANAHQATMAADQLGIKRPCWRYVREVMSLRGLRDSLIIVVSTATELPEWSEMAELIRQYNFTEVPYSL